MRDGKAMVLALIIIVGSQSCIDPVDIPSTPPENLHLVVEGFITNMKGPHVISLSRTGRFGSVFEGITIPETNAKVAIRDDTGAITELDNIGGGNYVTGTDFMATVGRSFSILIAADNGEQFLSTPQHIEEGAELDFVELRYNRLPSNHPVKFRSGVELYANFNDTPNIENYYLWTTSDGVYPWSSHPELFVRGFCPPEDSARNCFRYERAFNERRHQFSDEECIQSSRSFFSFNILSDQFRDGHNITQLAAFIEDDGRRFEYVYRVILHQFTVSQRSFAFHQRLRDQLAISGDIFDPPPANIGGNIVNISNPNIEALGFFGAYYVSSKEIYIDRDVLETTQRKVLFANDCWRLDSSTLEIPPWWQGRLWD